MNVGDRRALILAGGKGTRLAAAVPDRPKILAPIDDRTFLDVLVSELARRGFSRLAFLLGFRHAEVVAALERTRRLHPSLRIEWSIEQQPLGTAGAVKHARDLCTEDFFLINGDTYLDFDAQALLETHERTGAAVTLAAARVPDTSRYGSLELAADGRLLRFREKTEQSAPGLINGGVYVIAPRVLDGIAHGRAVSLEHEVFPQLLSRGERLAVVEQRGAFFDIGTEASWREFTRYCAEQRGAST
jgi:NDP-sugar pyrophosphorylase family protein